MNCMIFNCNNNAGIQMRFSMIGVPEGREDMVAFERNPLGEWVFTYCDEHRLLISNPVPTGEIEYNMGSSEPRSFGGNPLMNQKFVYPRVEIDRHLLADLDPPLGYNPVST